MEAGDLPDSAEFRRLYIFFIGITEAILIFYSQIKCFVSICDSHIAYMIFIEFIKLKSQPITQGEWVDSLLY